MAKKPHGDERPAISETTLPESLRDLVDVPLTSPSLASRAMDGRLVPLVLATVTALDGSPRGGTLVELLDAAGEVVDATRTSANGLAVLRFPHRAPADPGMKATHRGHDHSTAGDEEALPEVSGEVRVSDGSRDGTSDEVVVPAGRHHAVKSFVARADDETGVLPGDDQLSRLPTDFSPQTCSELSTGRTNGLLGATGLGTRADPLLPAPAAGQLSLAGRRTPLVRRLDVVRRTTDGRRWLVQLRQEWVLLGYTLGELASVTPLDPGSVLQHADQVVEQVSTAVRETTDRVSSTLTQTLGDLLSSFGSVDTVVNATASTSAGVVGGFFGIPGVFGVGGAYATLDTSATASTDIDTSLLVNRSLHQVSTLVNEAIARAQAVAEGAQRTAANVVNHLAPLVSKVTNALHWRVYENYAVCTHVDGVLAVEEHPISAGDTFRFDATWARAFRAFLEPALLDRSLVANFTGLAVAAETPGLATAHVEITYDATLNPGTAAVTLGGTSMTFALPPGNGQVARGTLTFPAPVAPGSRLTGTATFTPGAPLSTPFFTIPSTLTVRRFAVWVDNPLTGAPDQADDNPGTSVNLDIATEGLAALNSGDALVQHLNANRAYYLDVLAAAAARFPALRVDASRSGGPLAGIPAELWRLPIVGFEGNMVLVARPLAAGETPSHAELLQRDPGSGTLVQLLARGSYGEVLQGVAALTDLTNNLHPALKAIAPPQFVEFPEQPVLPPAPLGGTPAGGAAGTATGAAGTVTGAVTGAAGAVTGGLGG
jgi:hypothetical protein